MLGKRKTPNRMRREKKERRKPQLPSVTLPWRSLSLLALAGIVVLAAWRLMDLPVRTIAIQASFQRVTAMQIEDVVRKHIGSGLLSTDLDEVRQALTELDWIDDARVRRQWPDAIAVSVTEQVAAARWGDDGLLNTRGELFATSSRHPASELPRLAGPAGEETQVAARYLQLHSTLLEYGFQLLSVNLDERGSWQMELSSGVRVQLGRESVDQRVERFLQLVTPLIAGRADQVEYIDMRYANGFAIGWAKIRPENSGEDKDV